jgi:hypothetical protein
MAFAPLSTSVDDNGFAIGGSRTAVVAAGAGTTVIKPRAGRLCNVVVTTAGTATDDLKIYDNASTGTGTLIAVIPGAATLGTAFVIGMPALNGITAVGVSGSAAVTVSFS